MNTNNSMNRLFVQVAVGVATGVVLARSADWLGRKVVHIVSINQELPILVRNSLEAFVRLINSPITIPLTNIAQQGRLSRIISYNQFTSILTPILEETIYRYGLQTGTKLGLMRMGVPEAQATLVAISITSHLFGLAHDKEYDVHFSVAAICGIAFGLMQEHFGLRAAIVAHGVYNAVLE